MLKKKNRLTKNSSFNYVYKRGAAVSYNALVLVYLSSNNQSNSKVGFSVSNKIGKAVVRNKIKRRLREVVAGIFSHIKRGSQLIFSVKPGIVEASFDDIYKAVVFLLKKAGQYVEAPALNTGGSSALKAQDKAEIKNEG